MKNFVKKHHGKNENEAMKPYIGSNNDFIICFSMNSYEKLWVRNQIVLPERINKTYFERFVKNEIRNSLSDPVNSMNIS